MSSITELSVEVALAADAADAAQSEVASPRRTVDRTANALATAIYVGIHLSSLLVFYTGASVEAVALCAATFFVRMFGITGVYHRYFSHRTYRTSRPMQFLLAFLGTSAVQKGPLWWASTHRLHHRHSDHEGDPHSPRLRGFAYAHQGWIFDERWDATREEQVKDLARYPELVWLNRWHFVAPVLLAVLCWALLGFSGLVWGFAVSTTLLWHATYSINSLAHKFGRVRYETGDDSRNNFWLALLTLGEGWHNNHHYYQSTVRQGFYWWEIDVTYYALRALAALGLVWELKLPPERVYADARARRDAQQQQQQRGS
jgi:stearoyl-CoA desaturase (delta-9 desaturase)